MAWPCVHVFVIVFHFSYHMSCLELSFVSFAENEYTSLAPKKEEKCPGKLYRELLSFNPITFRKS